MQLTVFCVVGSILAVASAQDDVRVIAASNDFAFRLLPLLSGSQRDNVFYSPYSVTTALAMVYAGADGTTLRELHESLSYNLVRLAQDKVLSAHAEHNRLLLAPSNSTLKIANAAVVGNKLNPLPGYVKALKDGFGAELLKVDFIGAGQAAVNVINSWVNQKTQHKISTLFEKPLSKDTRLVLLNAIYFKGTWRTKFDKSKTEKAAFYTGDGRSTSVDTMQGTVKAGFAYARDIGATVLDLPYNGLDYSMTILLPRNKTGVEVLRKNLNLLTFRDALSRLREATVAVYLPRFKLEEEYKLKKVLPRLGIKRMFNTGEADLSRINGGRDLFVDEVVHKAVVEVNEEGSEAAATTAVVINTRTTSGPEVFRADHPFLFFIRNRRIGDILFVGLVNKV
ncbi:intracellular coagulation inhibitor 1 isoform X2 [Dermacentor silvarum]|uniref:intracellular coagulation inhibitor 1 isoform X2 n=1 Tax=Dermacentor silvarum TaxID=543639 RepID=UPI00189886A3|nr:intracellular coagulation inhibitor 1 isoform X2 [Dermacentor silvarum]XP_049521538.1 intracellular coagulation inhibitor 1 isoform X2 [Dermacentor silvarum]XP_049521539.1 intracellular coagulation inhibitor 1 isoform X2 [Dermacentor silvarum]XP_049521540.1 intracellular coagulation inhibitor 1 isoform X2 [Dermacentor silvarum]